MKKLSIIFFVLISLHASAQRRQLNWVDVMRSGTANTFAGWNASGVASVLTSTEVTAQLNTFTSGLKGLTPASGGGTTTFLRADGTWATPGGGGATVPGGAASSVQYNNAGAFGGFGEWDGSSLEVPGIINPALGVVTRQDKTTGNYRRRWQTPLMFGGSGASGNSDFNLFVSDLVQDALATVTIHINGVSADGSEGYSAIKTISLRKDAAADMVQVGAVTTVHQVEDSPNVPFSGLSIVNSGGVDYLRVSFDSNSLTVYTWSIYLDITYSVK